MTLYRLIAQISRIHVVKVQGLAMIQSFVQCFDHESLY